MTYAEEPTQNTNVFASTKNCIQGNFLTGFFKVKLLNLQVFSAFAYLKKLLRFKNSVKILLYAEYILYARSVENSLQMPQHSKDTLKYTQKRSPTNAASVENPFPILNL